MPHNLWFSFPSIYNMGTASLHTRKQKVEEQMVVFQVQDVFIHLKLTVSPVLGLCHAMKLQRSFAMWTLLSGNANVSGAREGGVF